MPANYLAAKSATSTASYSALMMWEVYGRTPSDSEIAGMQLEAERLTKGVRSSREKLLLARYQAALKSVL